MPGKLGSTSSPAAPSSHWGLFLNNNHFLLSNHQTPWIQAPSIPSRSKLLGRDFQESLINSRCHRHAPTSSMNHAITARAVSVLSQGFLQWFVSSELCPTEELNRQEEEEEVLLMEQDRTQI